VKILLFSETPLIQNVDDVIEVLETNDGSGFSNISYIQTGVGK